ncbi:MAG: T9SS type A sorting domain-containing protein [Muribaculum sp.]|nr:T9SS type A sorting domain-containing protein [Muribaculum sp.]
MKKFFAIVTLLSLFVIAKQNLYIIQAQDYVTYIYDASGNRVKREKTSFPMPENIDSVMIKLIVYPNPTVDIVNVEVEGIVEGQIFPATLLSLDGNSVMHVDLEPFNQIDLSNCPQGWYFLNVESAEHKTKTVKILKR